jgi:hypothetical protein
VNLIAAQRASIQYGTIGGHRGKYYIAEEVAEIRFKVADRVGTAVQVGIYPAELYVQRFLRLGFSIKKNS